MDTILTRKVQFQEVELERTAKQLKEALAIANEETTRCTAAKEVIKSLTAQVTSNNMIHASTGVISYD